MTNATIFWLIVGGSFGAWVNYWSIKTLLNRWSFEVSYEAVDLALSILLTEVLLSIGLFFIYGIPYFNSWLNSL